MEDAPIPALPNTQTVTQTLTRLPQRPTLRTLNTRQIKNEFAAAKRGRALLPDLSDGDAMLDRIVLDTKPIYVKQEDGRGRPSAEVISSRVWIHTPQLPDKPIPRFKPMVFPAHPGKKMCSWCGDWREVKHFSDDSRNRDGLQSHCKFCHAERERKRYWERKLEAEMKV